MQLATLKFCVYHAVLKCKTVTDVNRDATAVVGKGGSKRVEGNITYKKQKNCYHLMLVSVQQQC